MRDQPFTYPMYLRLSAMSPFFAGYDDVMVGLGCSEAVLGLKGVGKTAFTSAKIAAIGTKKRILPIEDIEEIPTKAYRKKGFHIGAVQVQSSDREEMGSNELDLVSMTNAALRMGDACVIINEIRSRLAIQGVINMLNTQPGIFLLYNLHAQSLKDIQDRLEMVFGLPAASMYSTDRYSFLKKIRFGRKTRVYRMLGFQYETDLKERKFVQVFSLQRGEEIESTNLNCLFLDMPEANAKSLAGIDLGKVAGKLKLNFVPPALERRCEETGIPPEQYIMEAFFKGKMYSLIVETSAKAKTPRMAELDFVLKCSTQANNLLKREESKGETVNWAAIDREWQGIFAALVKSELEASGDESDISQEGKDALEGLATQKSKPANSEDKEAEEDESEAEAQPASGGKKAAKEKKPKKK
jgi:hypothetical protein